jgi:hypothetical protein
VALVLCGAGREQGGLWPLAFSWTHGLHPCSRWLLLAAPGGYWHRAAGLWLGWVLRENAPPGRLSTCARGVWGLGWWVLVDTGIGAGRWLWIKRVVIVVVIPWEMHVISFCFLRRPLFAACRFPLALCLYTEFIHMHALANSPHLPPPPPPLTTPPLHYTQQ